MTQVNKEDPIAKFDEIRTFIVSHKDILSRCKITPFFFPLQKDKVPVEFITVAYTWFTKLLKPAILEYLRIWDMLPPETWTIYFTLGDYQDHREVKELSDRRSRLKMICAVRNRPRLFQKSKVNAAIAEIKALELEKEYVEAGSDQPNDTPVRTSKAGRNRSSKRKHRHNANNPNPNSSTNQEGTNH